MDFQEIQNKVMANAERYSKKHQIAITTDFALIKLFEEVGEFAEAVMTLRKMSRPVKHLPDDIAKEKVAEELADVVGTAIINAKMLDIDLEQALYKKWISKVENR